MMKGHPSGMWLAMTDGASFPELRHPCQFSFELVCYFSGVHFLFSFPFLFGLHFWLCWVVYNFFKKNKKLRKNCWCYYYCCCCVTSARLKKSFPALVFSLMHFIGPSGFFFSLTSSRIFGFFSLFTIAMRVVWIFWNSFPSTSEKVSFTVHFIPGVVSLPFV